ncbi:MAG TPA: HAMP domain-containing protein, partial [Candidatus Didemnitutus sp.]
MLIRHKIFAAFGAMGAIVGAIALVAILNHEAIRYDLSQVGKAALEKPALVEEAVNALQELKFETEIAAARSIARPGELPRAPAVGAGALDDFDRRLAACRTAAEQSLALLKLEGLPSEIKVGEDELRAIGEVEALSASFRHRLATATKEDSVGALHRAGYDELLRRLNEYRAQVGRQAQAEIADVETGLRHADSATLWSSVALLLFGAAIAVFSATVLVRPIQSLTKTVRQIAAGEHQSLIAVHSRDEFGALTESFNAMLDQIQSQEKELRAAHDDLEQRVTERTAELQNEIGERVRVAAELNNTMARLTAIWESAPLSIMILEPNDPA